MTSVFTWKRWALVSVASVSEAPHVLVLVTWVTWVYFPILFSLFSPGEEEGLVTTCRKSGTLGISAQHVSVSPFLCWSRPPECPHTRKGSGTGCMGPGHLRLLVYCLNWRPVFHLCTPVTCTGLPLLQGQGRSLFFSFLWSLWLDEAQSLPRFPHYWIWLSAHIICLNEEEITLSPCVSLWGLP